MLRINTTTMLKLRYTSLIIIFLFQSSGFSQATTEIKIMTYNTSDNGDVWTATTPTRISNMRSVINAINPDTSNNKPHGMASSGNYYLDPSNIASQGFPPTFFI